MLLDVESTVKRNRT